MYHHVSDCIRLDSIVSYGLSPCQAMSGRHWLGILLAAPDQDNLHWAVGVHLSVFIPLPPLAGSRSLCLCMCGWCVSAQIQASCVCTMSKSEWRVFFGLPDSPSLSLYLFSHASTADMFGKVPAVLGRTLNGHYFTREEDLGLVHTTGLSGICNARVTCAGRKRSMVCRFPADGEGGPPQSNWALQCCSCIGGKFALANACVYMRLCVCCL